MDDLRAMTRRQVQQREQRLRKRAEQISREVKVARRDGQGLPWMSRETGTDMSFEFEHWRRWAALANEMKRRDADVVADLGSPRVAYWQTALDEARTGVSEPLSAFRPVEPLVRHAPVPANKPFRVPPGPDGPSG